MPNRSYRWSTAAPLGAAVFLCASIAQAAPDLEALTAQARALGLAEQSGWLALVHYERSAWGGWRSTAESETFFLAPSGPRDPAAELDATLAALLEDRAIPEREETARCAFGAREQWLRDQLGAAFELPPADCSRREAWRAALNPQRVWVVFPSAYLNSPASMFGHTLLRLDGPEVTPQTPLLAYAVNFAANTDETNGLAFAIKGLSGGYAGQFSVLPYYEKVKEYARLENRDLWEYPLQLEPAEIERLLLHLWELRGVEFRYYFLTKNCSYQLLALLRAARPQLDWGDAFDWRAIPADTVRVLGPLLGPPEYRPALATTLRHRADQLPPADRALVTDLGRGALSPDSLDGREPQATARILDVAHDWLYYRFHAGHETRAAVLPRAQSLLRARAATRTRSEFPAVPTPEVSPDRGHATRRLATAVFATEDSTGLRLRYRPAYHDLLDPEAGYGEGQQLQFLDLAVALDLESDRLALEELRVIDLVSLAPRDDLFQPISWNASVGLRRMGTLTAPLAAYLDAGPGLTWRAGSWLAHAFLQSSLEAHRQLDDDHVWLLGPRLGLTGPLAAGWRASLEGAVLEPIGGASLDRRWLELQQHWQVHPAFGLRLSGRRESRAGQRFDETVLGLHYYF